MNSRPSVRQKARAHEQSPEAIDSTPFYAEGGGQVGDRGHFEWNGGRAVVHHTLKSNDLHIHEVLIEGTHALSVGATLQAKVESSERRETANNHSATHLMHAALRMVLGTHVTQQGSLVDSEKLRFDFSHSKALTTEEIRQIEDLVNEQIAASLAVTAEKMTPPEAIKKGALALFGEKYGSEVRVLSMGDFSMELCGGTHVSNTSQIRMFLIVSESGVSSGVRRIEALTGARALEFLQKHRRENLLAREATGHAEGWSAFLQSQKSALDWIETAKNQIKDLQKELRKSKSATVNPEDLLKTSRSFAAKGGSSKVVAAQVGIDDREALSQLADQLKNKVGSGIVVLLGEGADSRPLIVSVSKDLNPDFKAGDLLREVAAALGGKGGGRPDFAQGAVPPGGAWAEADRTLAKILKIQ